GGSGAAGLARHTAGGLLHTGAVLATLALLGALSRRAALAPTVRAAALVTLVAVDLAAASSSAYVLTPGAAAHPPSPFAERLRAEPGLHRVVSPFDIPGLGAEALRPFEREARGGAATLHSGWNVDHRIGNFEPYTGMIPARLMRFRLRTGWMHQHPQVGMWGVDLAVVPADDPDPGRMNLGPPHDVVARDEEQRQLLVRIPHRPRAYLAAEPFAVDRRGAMEFVLDPASVTTERTALEGPVPAGLSPPAGEVELRRDDRERVELGATTDRRALLVLNDMYASGWTAEVDGAPASIWPANYLARGVWLEPGRHRVVFTYRTPGLAVGVAIGCALALALGLWALAERRRPEPPAPL
ncbi:MAG TPA: YfhO family protein, partial [Anaeromyxobacteraceae bacterium]|nr:YfhO family protein [Anaeromyxobacteraceae bacterium]